MEFALNVFIEFAEFSDKKIKNQKGGLQDWNPGETETVPLSHRATGNRADPYSEPNSCVEFSLLRLVWIFLHLLYLLNDEQCKNPSV